MTKTLSWISRRDATIHSGHAENRLRCCCCVKAMRIIDAHMCRKAAVGTNRCTERRRNRIAGPKSTASTILLEYSDSYSMVATNAERHEPVHQLASAWSTKPTASTVPVHSLGTSSVVSWCTHSAGRRCCAIVSKQSRTGEYRKRATLAQQ